MMGKYSNYQLDFYNQFEKLNIKLDELLVENKNQSLTIYNLNKEILKLNKQLDEANELNKKLQDEIDRLNNQNNKNSTNSSKPSSTDIVKPKKSGANLYNYRIKSNRNVGGQLGHTGHNLSKKKIDKLINNNKIEVRIFEHTIKGNPKKQGKIKYKIGIDIKPYVEKHIFKYDYNSNNTLEKYENKYDEIIQLAIKENQTIKSTFYKEKANQLYRRLKKYKANHLYFIKDFTVRFDNNISEQDLRIFKIKTKISGCFRSIEGTKNYSNILSIIKISIKRNINPYDSICKIFNNEELFTN